MSVYKNDPPVVVEHTTINPTVERNTIIERDTSWYSEPWAIALIIGAIAVIGIIAYWALYNPSTQNTPTYVSSTTIDRTVPDQRAQTITPSAVTPQIVVTPPAVNITPPATSNSNSGPSTPPVVINNTPPASSNNGGASNGSGTNNGSGMNGSGNGGPDNGGANGNVPETSGSGSNSGQ